VSNEERYVVSAGLPIVVHVGVRNMFGVLSIKVAGGVLEKRK
jgi:hypothetical protein